MCKFSLFLLKSTLFYYRLVGAWQVVLCHIFTLPIHLSAATLNHKQIQNNVSPCLSISVSIAKGIDLWLIDAYYLFIVWEWFIDDWIDDCHKICCQLMVSNPKVLHTRLLIIDILVHYWLLFFSLIVSIFVGSILGISLLQKDIIQIEAFGCNAETY